MHPNAGEAAPERVEGRLRSRGAFAWAFYGYRQARWRRLARRLAARAD